MKGLTREKVYKQFIDGLNGMDDIVILAQVLCNRINSCYKKHGDGIKYVSWKREIAPKKEKYITLVITEKKKYPYVFNCISLFKKDIKMLLKLSKKQLINWIVYRCKLS